MKPVDRIAPPLAGTRVGDTERRDRQGRRAPAGGQASDRANGTRERLNDGVCDPSRNPGSSRHIIDELA